MSDRYDIPTPTSSTFTTSSYNPPNHRECLVPSCHKKLCYARLAGEKIYSNFCFRHTCSHTVSIEDGYHCPMPKSEFDSLCANHMTCAHPSCTETGSYATNTCPWFCPRHRCSKPSCTLGVYDLLSNRCRHHQECAALQCTSLPWFEEHSSFCERHTCSVGDCSLQAIRARRCSEHVRCSVPSCLRQCKVKANGKLEALCPNHLEERCAKPGCGRKKVRGERRYCHEHWCRVTGCEEERRVGGPLCDVHRCTFDDCTEVIGEVEDERGSSLFCKGHACRVGGCLYSREGRSLFCERHRCGMGGCTKQGRGDGGLCYVHEDEVCIVQGDGRCRVEGCGMGTHGAYCELHDWVGRMEEERDTLKARYEKSGGNKRWSATVEDVQDEDSW